MNVLAELKKAGERHEEARKNGLLIPVPASFQVRMDAEAGTDVMSPAYLDHFTDPVYREGVKKVIAKLRDADQVRTAAMAG